MGGVEAIGVTVIWVIYKLKNGKHWYLADHNKKVAMWTSDKHKGMLFGSEQDARDCKQFLFGSKDVAGIQGHVVHPDGSW